MQYIYIGLIVLLALLAVFLIVYFPIKWHVERKSHAKLINKKLYKLADSKDYYLLNNLVLNVDEETTLHINHLLCADKYIYVIVDRYYKGGISGAYEDETWFSYTKKGKKPIRNLMFINEERTIRLAKYLGWNESKAPVMVSVIVVNDDVVISDELLHNKNDYSFIVKKKNLVKFIKAFEDGAKVDPLEVNNVQKIVDTIHKMSLEASGNEENAN